MANYRKSGLTTSTQRTFLMVVVIIKEMTKINELIIDYITS